MLSLALALVLALSPQDRSVDASAVEQAWKSLPAARQKDAVRLLARRCDALSTSQMKILRALLAADRRRDEDLPRAKPLPFYDPDQHAPGLPIARKELDAKDSRLAAACKSFLPPPDAARLRSGFRYDWGARRIERTAELSPIDVVINAWNGYPPGLDRAWASALLALDAGHEARALAAFDHTYTDRAGRVYPGITLFDAWSSGVTMEMPDVDALGIVHDVLDDWTTWVSPVPAQDHAALYARIQQIFEPARRYRELCEALADVLLIGKPPRRGNLWRTTTNLHAAWAACESDPARLAHQLPGAAGARTFVETWVDRCQQDSDLYLRAKEREAELEADGRAVRSALLDVLCEVGALDAPSAPGAPAKKSAQPH